MSRFGKQCGGADRRAGRWHQSLIADLAHALYQGIALRVHAAVDREKWGASSASASSGLDLSAGYMSAKATSTVGRWLRIRPPVLTTARACARAMGHGPFFDLEVSGRKQALALRQHDGQRKETATWPDVAHSGSPSFSRRSAF